MSESLGLFDPDEDDYDEDDGGRRGRGRRGRGPRKRRSRKFKWIVGIVVVLVIVAGAGFGVAQIYGFGYYADYSGNGTSDVVIQVNDGDTTRDIGNTMEQAGVVASANAFVKAAATNVAVGSVQPGYYEVKEHMSGSAAVTTLVSPHSRVGQLQVKAGVMLNNTTSTTGKVTQGLLSDIAKATCATINGKSTCLTVAQLTAAIQSSSPTALGVPEWAVPAVTAADAKHRLEGLIMQGVYDLKPGENAVQTLNRILSQSAAQMQAAGLPSSVQQSSGFSPYQVLILASIIERESGVDTDMPKVSRVLYNRLASTDPSINRLSLDSTVDYALDRPAVLTSPSERPGAGPYDSYDNAGLPPTPISSPSAKAIQAAMSPVAGPWLYFVVCEKDGTSCFASTLAEHQANVARAQQNGAY